MENDTVVQDARGHLDAGRPIEAMNILMDLWKANPGDEGFRLELARVARKMKSLRHKQVLYQDVGGGEPRFGQAVDDQYLILERISESPGVTLYRVHDEKGSEYLTLWYIDPLWRNSELRQGWVMAELAKLHAFEHPACARLRGFGAPTDDEAYALLDPPRGRLLSDYIAEHGRMPPEGVARVMTWLLDCLAAAHDVGIFHGNLRADHIVISGEGVRILDLGLYPMIRQLHKARKMTRTGQVPGLLAHLPPEFERAEGPDVPWDICTAGSLAYEALTGHPPYGYPEGRQIRSFLMKMKDPVVPRPIETEGGEDLPVWADDVVTRMIARDPYARYGSIRETLQAWRAATGT